LVISYNNHSLFLVVSNVEFDGIRVIDWDLTHDGIWFRCKTHNGNWVSSQLRNAARVLINDNFLKGWFTRNWWETIWLGFVLRVLYKDFNYLQAKGKFKNGSFADFWSCGQVTTKAHCNLLGYVKAKPVAARVEICRMLTLGLEERLEQLGHVGRADSNAEILNWNICIYFEAIKPCLNSHNDLGHLWGELYSVLNDINENLLHPLMVYHHHFIKTLLARLVPFWMHELRNYFDFHLFSLQLQQLSRLLHKIAQVSFDRVGNEEFLFDQVGVQVLFRIAHQQVRGVFNELAPVEDALILNLVLVGLV
jgi:hypothetical protein